MPDYSSFIKKFALPDGFRAPTRLVYEDLVAQALTRDHLEDDVRGINASLDLIRRTRGGRGGDQRAPRPDPPPAGGARAGGSGPRGVQLHRPRLARAGAPRGRVVRVRGVRRRRPLPRVLLPVPEGPAHAAVGGGARPRR